MQQSEPVQRKQSGQCLWRTCRVYQSPHISELQSRAEVVPVQSFKLWFCCRLKTYSRVPEGSGKALHTGWPRVSLPCPCAAAL